MRLEIEFFYNKIPCSLGPLSPWHGKSWGCG